MPSSSAILETKAQTSGGMVVVLNGFPGTGKITILKQLQALLAPDVTRLLDNHLLIDPAQALIPDRSDAHHDLRQRIRASCFGIATELAQRGFIILLTTCLAEDNGGRDTGVLQEHLDIVRGTDVPLYWVNAHCSLEELGKRVGSPERRSGSKTKLTDMAILNKIVKENSLISPREGGDATIIVGTLDASGPLADSVALLMKLVGMAGRVKVISSDGSAK
ncbi:hypothetical protein GGX14DRAFT_431427 [Mycena pura]|uniref:Uncharacterized protein n=1 Tax=Mycena pura TaxID=153505 RepID=A0AAD6YK00_9AGAR|nr:hypothetical protein GGX14DRAFT_431427 [Mycena pura]